MVLSDHPVDHPLGRGGEDEAGEPIHEQQREPQAEATAVGIDEPARLLPGARGDGMLGRSGLSGLGIGHGRDRNLRSSGRE